MRDEKRGREGGPESRISPERLGSAKKYVCFACPRRHPDHLFSHHDSRDRKARLVYYQCKKRLARPREEACCAAVILIKLRSGDCPDAAFCLAFPRSQPVSSFVLTIWNLGEMASRGILAVLALLLVATYSQKTSQQDPAGGNTQPNMIFILTDDQDLHMDSVAYMPHLKKLIIEQGMTFKKHYCTVALCCPSRVSLWTGKAAHNTNVTDVNPPYGR